MQYHRVGLLHGPIRILLYIVVELYSDFDNGRCHDSIVHDIQSCFEEHVTGSLVLDQKVPEDNTFTRLLNTDFGEVTNKDTVISKRIISRCVCIE